MRLIVIVVLLTVGAVLGLRSLQNTPTVEPYARWRNGVVVAIHHCEAPDTEQRILKCAAYVCVQRASQRLTNAQQAQISLDYVRRTSDGQRIEVRAQLKQFFASRRLPYGFICRSRRAHEAEPEFLFDLPVTPD